jgi:hypothetical protein
VFAQRDGEPRLGRGALLQQQPAGAVEEENGVGAVEPLRHPVRLLDGARAGHSPGVVHDLHTVLFPIRRRSSGRRR